MKEKIKIDINELVLCNVLECLLTLEYKSIIKKKLYNFINYLIEDLYNDKNKYSYGDIVSQDYYCITTYKGNDNNASL